jgi:hypothetical protein
MVATVGLTGTTSLAGVAAAQGQRAGDVVVIDGTNGSELLTSGGGATPFSLRLPEAAACPGDSANDNYRVQTFIVPVADDPATLTYESQKPAGDGRWALYDVNTSPYAQVLTEVASAPGQPGRITPLSQLSFAVFPTGTFPDGRYRIGVACTQWSETVRYWDTEIDIVADPGADPADDPAQLRWAVVGAPAPSGVAGLPLLVGVTVVAVLGAVVVLALRRRMTPASPSSPSTPSPANATPDHTQEQP